MSKSKLVSRIKRTLSPPPPRPVPREFGWLGALDSNAPREGNNTRTVSLFEADRLAGIPLNDAQHEGVRLMFQLESEKIARKRALNAAELEGVRRGRDANGVG